MAAINKDVVLVVSVVLSVVSLVLLFGVTCSYIVETFNVILKNEDTYT